MIWRIAAFTIFGVAMIYFASQGITVLALIGTDAAISFAFVLGYLFAKSEKYMRHWLKTGRLN